jgi:hypothetical protein
MNQNKKSSFNANFHQTVGWVFKIYEPHCILYLHPIDNNQRK